MHTPRERDGAYVVGLATRPGTQHYWPCESLPVALRFAGDLRAHGWRGRVWIEEDSASASRRVAEARCAPPGAGR
jgi:hypothetical protein